MTITTVGYDMNPRTLLGKITNHHFQTDNSYLFFLNIVGCAFENNVS